MGITFTTPGGSKKELQFKKLRFPRSSNLLTSTSKNSVADSGNAVFESSNNSVPDTTMPTYTRSIKTSLAGYPYRPAKLVVNSDINKPWWIVFYCWDITKEILVRKRVGKSELAMYDTKTERRQAAQKYIEDINYHLLNDHVVETDPEPLIPTVNFHGYTITQAIEYAAKYKFDIEGVSEGTKKEYLKIKASVERFLKWKELPSNYKLRNVNMEFVQTYFMYLKAEKKFSNKTHNQHRTMLHAAIECLKQQNPKLFGGINPFGKIAFLKTKSKKHAAYSKAQMDLISKEVESTDRQFLLFIQFIYYTLARPRKELRLLKVKDIRLDSARILMQGENSKAAEEYVGINDHFAKLIIDSGILKYEPNHYVFTQDGKPGPVPTGKNYFYKRLTEVLKATGLDKVNEDFTLYGFKHSGAIALYLATKDIKLLQAQCRHRSIEQTDKYLRDLGLFQDFTQLNKVKW